MALFYLELSKLFQSDLEQNLNSLPRHVAVVCPASSGPPLPWLTPAASCSHQSPASAWTWKRAKLAPTFSPLPCLLLPLEKFVLDIFSWSAQFSPQRSPHEGNFLKHPILNGLLFHPSKLGFWTSLLLSIREPLAP